MGMAILRMSSTPGAPSEILAHVCDLFDWALSLARGKQVWHDSTPAAWDTDVERFFRALAELDADVEAVAGQRRVVEYVRIERGRQV